MALLLSKVLDTGVTATYHRIGKGNFDTRVLFMNVKVDTFLNEAAYLAGKASLFSFDVVPPQATVATMLTGTDIRALIYTYLKTIPEYSGATDI